MRSCQVCHRRQQFSLFEPQTFRDKDTLKSVEKKLNQQRKQSRGNRALQNRLVIIQVKPVDNWFSQPADADECRYGSGADVNNRTGFYPGLIPKNGSGTSNASNARDGIV